MQHLREREGAIIAAADAQLLSAPPKPKSSKFPKMEIGLNWDRGGSSELRVHAMEPPPHLSSDSPFGFSKPTLSHEKVKQNYPLSSFQNFNTWVQHQAERSKHLESFQKRCQIYEKSVHRLPLLNFLVERQRHFDKKNKEFETESKTPTLAELTKKLKKSKQLQDHNNNKLQSQKTDTGATAKPIESKQQRDDEKKYAGLRRQLERGTKIIKETEDLIKETKRNNPWFKKQLWIRAAIHEVKRDLGVLELERQTISLKSGQGKFSQQVGSNFEVYCEETVVQHVLPPLLQLVASGKGSGGLVVDSFSREQKKKDAVDVKPVVLVLRNVDMGVHLIGATGELDFIVVEAQPLPVGSDQPGNPDHVDQAGAQQGVDPQILSKKAAKKKQNLEKRAKKKGGGKSNEYPVWRVLRVLKVVECKNSSIDMWSSTKKLMMLFNFLLGFVKNDKKASFTELTTTQKVNLCSSDSLVRRPEAEGCRGAEDGNTGSLEQKSISIRLTFTPSSFGQAPPELNEPNSQQEWTINYLRERLCYITREGSYAFGPSSKTVSYLLDRTFSDLNFSPANTAFLARLYLKVVCKLKDYERYGVGNERGAELLWDLMCRKQVLCVDLKNVGSSEQLRDYLRK